MNIKSYFLNFSVRKFLSIFYISAVALLMHYFSTSQQLMIFAQDYSKTSIYCIPSSRGCIQELWDSFAEIEDVKPAHAHYCPKDWTFAMLCRGDGKIITHSGPLKSDTIQGQIEINKFKKTFPDYDSLPEYVIAHSAVGVVVSSRFVISSLSVKELGDIFSGKTKNWKSLGGPDQKIVIIGQDGGYHSGQILSKCCNFYPFVYDYVGLVKKSNFVTVSDAVKKTPGAIGFFLHPTPVNNEVIKAIKSVKLLRIAPCDRIGKPVGEAVLPTLETLVKGTYPLTDPLVIILHPESSLKFHRFASYVQSEEGAKIVRKYALFPEYDRQKYLSDERLDAVKKGKGEELTVYGHRPGLGVFRLLNDEFVKAKSPVQLKYLVKSQAEATTAFLNREVDMLLVDEPFKEKTLEKHASQITRFHPEKFDLGQVGVGIIVHPLNKVDWLKQEELLNIFTSQTRYWSQIQREGATAGNSPNKIETPINKFGLNLRSKQDVSHPVIELFQETILQEKRMKKVRGVKTSAEVINSVSLDANSIGFINLADLDTSKTNVKLIGIIPEGKSFPETVRNPKSKTPESGARKNQANQPRKKLDYIRFGQWEVSAGYPLLRTWSLYVNRRSKDIAWEFADYVEAKTKDQKWLFIDNPDDLFGGPEQVTRSLREHGLIRPTEEELFVKKTKGPKPVFTLP